MLRTAVLATAGAVLLQQHQQAAALKVGFLGDSGAGSDARNTYRIMRENGVDLVVQNGDYDYRNSPSRWSDFLDREWYDTGRPHALMSSGNHDVGKWDGSSGYQSKLFAKLSSKLRSSCHGRDGRSLSSDYGQWTSCAVDDVQFVMVGWDEMDGRISRVVDFVNQEFERSTARWRVCVWHRPEGSLNPGHRHTSNYGEWEAYEACREHGALVVSGHSHCYGRTKLLSHFQSKRVSSRSRSDRVDLSCGESFSVVAGMGGVGLDDLARYGRTNYMQSTYTTEDGDAAGALVCDFPSSGNAKCDMLVGSAPGRSHDSFELTTSCSGRGGTRAPAPVPVPGPSPPVGGGLVEVAVQVADGGDDVEEDMSRGRLSTSSTDLELLTDRGTRQVVGIRWEGVRIPHGATIVDARIVFTCDEISSGTGPSVSIAFDKDSDSDEWGSSRRPSQRTLTSAVEWDLSQSWTPGVTYESPNLAAALQEVVGIFDWARGNAVSAVVKQGQRASSASRVAESHNGDGMGPTLRVHYGVWMPVPPEPPLPVPVPEPATPAPVTAPTPPRTPVPAPVPAPTRAPVPTQTVERRVRISSGSDDVEQQSSRSLYSTSSDLELAYDGVDQTIGLRFRDVGVPRGAQITSAYVEFTADESDSGTSPTLVIRADDADSSAPFSTSRLPSRRSVTSASVRWSDLGRWSTGRVYRTPDLSRVVAEVASHSGWSASSSLSLLIDSISSSSRAVRVAESYEGKRSAAPLLVITYRV